MNELCHHGILGQRWGVRRYNNKYGALTPAGQKKKQQLEREYHELMSIGSITQKGKQRKSDVQKQYKSLTGKSIVTESRYIIINALRNKISETQGLAAERM